MNLLRKKRVLLVIFIAFVTVLFFRSAWMGTWLYPIPYKDVIEKHAKNYEVDPLLVAAIIRVESNYKPSQESRKGALGMMQVMPNTASWIIEQAKFDAVTLEDLKHEPEPNIQIGTWYIASLLTRFDQNKYAALAAYNAGPTVVAKWLQNETWDGSIEQVKKIPYGETKNYVQRVVYYYNKYNDIYGH
ncbi:lytic transglycosylase [Paenibacillus selenitireducens]|uniref:Lytic transglycosylase n=1 Tax=Paenibacillus selenitireducens TaxID=1324314 RepID=A0A1T2XM37_9BACL|nr:lytic transglycosylase domain-containing protein [Paenibacillus selenitireducens]OPA80929.1 lytic transglycosylase [Paenibacillus selenitireducens]